MADRPLSIDIRHPLMLKANDLVLLTREDGEILQPIPGFGLFYRDTCYLSSYALRLHGTAPLLLMSSDGEGMAAQMNLTNNHLSTANGRVIADHKLSLRRTFLVLDDGLVFIDTISMRNFSTDRVTLPLSLTTDTVRASPLPNAWRIGELTIADVVMGTCLLAFCVGVLAVGKYALNFGTEGLRALTFLALVFGSQATIYALRERGRLRGSRPSAWLAASSVVDVLIASTLAILGIAMAPLPAYLVGCTLAVAVAFAFVLDLVKRPVFARLKIT